MSTPTLDRAPVDELEALWAYELPCDGVHRLGIPPCGSAATWTRSFYHGCPPSTPAPHKCDKCYALFLRSLQSELLKLGALRCPACYLDFHAVDDIVRYRKL